MSAREGIEFLRGLVGLDIIAVDVNTVSPPHDPSPPGEGKLGHIRAADQDGAGRAKARNDRRVTLRRRAVVQSLRSGQGSLARYVEEVLQGNRQSGEWGGDVPGLAQPILRIGRRAGVLGVDLDEGTRAFAGGIGDLRERRFDQLTAGRAPIREICGDF